MGIERSLVQIQSPRLLQLRRQAQHSHFERRIAPHASAPRPASQTHARHIAGVARHKSRCQSTSRPAMIALVNWAVVECVAGTMS